MTSAPAERSWTRAQALRNPTFWLLVITFGIASVGIGLAGSFVLREVIWAN